MTDKSTYIDKSRVFIDSVGGLALAKELDVVPQVIWNWRRRGIPRGWSQYISSIYRIDWVKAGFNEHDIEKK